MKEKSLYILVTGLKLQVKMNMHSLHRLVSKSQLIKKKRKKKIGGCRLKLSNASLILQIHSIISMYICMCRAYCYFQYRVCRFVGVWFCNFARLAKWGEKIKGALDNFSLIPDFFSKKIEIFIITIRSVYLCSDCMRNLTCKFHLITKICEFFLQRPFFKVYFQKWLPPLWLLNLAPSTIILVWKKILKFVFAVLRTDTTINWSLCKSWHFGLE